jgi:hypothetical protein
MGPIRPQACHRTVAAAALSGPYSRGRPPGPGAGRGRGAREQPDGRLAVEASHGHDLVQEPVFLGSGGLLVARALHGGILAQAGSGHGALLREIGNRDF